MMLIDNNNNNNNSNQSHVFEFIIADCVNLSLFIAYVQAFISLFIQTR